MSDTTSSFSSLSLSTDNNSSSSSSSTQIDWEGTQTLATHRNNDLTEDFTCKASLAFDQWFACLTVGKQLSNYYRYGEKRSCGRHWSKLNLCMGMKMRSEEAGKELMRAFNAKEEAKRDAMPNVLDLWSKRTEPLEYAQTEDSEHKSTTSTF